MVGALIRSIGTDRHLHPDELPPVATRSLSAEMWTLYGSVFDRFTGACTDAQFARLDHPARFTAAPRVRPGTTVVIAGAGPSLSRVAPDLVRLRDRVSIWTSIRGAEALATHGLNADLVLVQHRCDLDAYLTVRHLRDRNGASPLDHVPVVLAEPRTPRALLARVPPVRLATFDPARGWGLWPASLVSLANESGAKAIALAGIDLGTRETPDPIHEPLGALLAALAFASRPATINAGGGAIKPGWPEAALASYTDPGGASAVALESTRWSSAAARRADLLQDLASLRDTLAEVTAFRALALESRAAGRRASDTRLADAWTALMSWHRSPELRRSLQEGLGATFLPRIWRQDRTDIRGPLWRPVLLATDEIWHQAAVARARLSELLGAVSA